MIKKVPSNINHVIQLQGKQRLGIKVRETIYSE